MIPLDRVAVQEILESFSRWATHEAAEYEPGTAAIDAEDTELDRLYYLTVRNAWGDTPVNVAFLASDGFGGGYGRHPSLGVLVKVFYDARYSLAALGTTVVQNRLRLTLMHELTHANDWIKKWAAQGGTRNEGPTRAENLVDPAGYYNDPTEVRAHTRELYEEIRDEVNGRMAGPLRTRWGIGKIIAVSLQQLPHWRAMLPHLTAANRNRILKKLAGAFR
jgi:hypothetical protein